MEKQDKTLGEQKFMALDASKRGRILNAAMKEFRYGYKKASTDAIVREAGISKGLLFHYFGTKENLYAFLMIYIAEIVQKQYFDMINYGQRDILEGLWQLALLRKDIYDEHPYFDDFLNGIYTHLKDIPGDEMLVAIWQNQDEIYDRLYKACDTSLFRDDIDPQKAFDLVLWAVGGYFDETAVRESSLKQNWADKNYEDFLEELRGYLNIFRQCFYKN